MPTDQPDPGSSSADDLFRSFWVTRSCQQKAHLRSSSLHSGGSLCHLPQRATSQYNHLGDEVFNTQTSAINQLYHPRCYHSPFLQYAIKCFQLGYIYGEDGLSELLEKGQSNSSGFLNIDPTSLPRTGVALVMLSYPQSPRSFLSIAFDLTDVCRLL